MSLFTNKFQLIFRISNFLDEIRWCNKGNYNLINFSRTDLSNAQKILIHWISYITDRQTPFRRIWDVGGFVFSDLVYEITNNKDAGYLNSKNPQSFFVTKNIKKKGFTFISRQKADNNKRLLQYGFKPGEKVRFSSRFYPADYKAILATFNILKKKNFDFNLLNYIKFILNFLDEDDKNFIKKVLYSLYLLTYYEIGNPSNSDLFPYEKILNEIENRTSIVMEIIEDEILFNKNFKTFSKDVIFKQKRAWCSLRDYLKNLEFKSYFITALGELGYKNLEVLKNPSILTQLELPGDVWNNNPKFRKCLFKDTKYENFRGIMPKLLRNVYKEEKIENGYPESFDITFDFVPRMCNLDKCNICPYGLIKGIAKDFQKVCINLPGKFCPVAISSCNYYYNCIGEKCKLHIIFKELNRKDN